MSGKGYGVTAAIEHLQRVQQFGGSREWRLTIKKANPGGLTAHQTVEVSALYQGFDWTAGQVIIEPAQPLTALSHDELQAVVESVRNGGSWHAYEREKKLRARIQDLERQLAANKPTGGKE